MTSDRPWWQTGVIYQIYPRSFQDSNGDGIGDLPGITARLDYLQDLGVTGIWLSPVYPSPMYDFGYDVSDYTDISPEFGTPYDFKLLLDEAHRRDIRIVMDLVFNHTSHQHPWFLEASASRGSPKRDWYIWHDGQDGARPQPPNNWLGIFGGKAWEWEANTEQFYLHSFLKEQPDVNWRNPELRMAMWDVIRFWLDLGVDGFRLDVVNWFIKDERFRDNPRKPWGLRPYDRQVHLYDRNRPETLEIMMQIRTLVDHYPERMTVGEVYSEPPGDPELSAAYYAGGEGLHMAFNFAFLYCPWRADSFATAVDRWDSLLGPDLWPNYTLSNHDQKRAFSRYDEGGDGAARARVAAALLLTLRGTPFLYYGEEIGMRNGRILRSRLQDPLGKRYWPLRVGRDGERTPMQWNASPGAGFSMARPWLPINADHTTVNVERQQEAPDSLLNWYRALIGLRRQEPSLHSGAYRRLGVRDEVYHFERQWHDQRVVVALNFAGRARTVRLPRDATWQVLLGWHHTEGETLPADDVPLEAYGVLIAKQKPQAQTALG